MTRFPSSVRLPLRGLATALVTLVGLAASAACNLQFSTGIEAKASWSHTYKVKADAVLEIREPNGRINIEATDGNEIQVQATKIAKGATEEAAKAAAEKIEINEKASDDRVELDSAAGFTMSMGSERRVDYDIKVPRTISLAIKTTNGDVKVTAVKGMLKIEAINGEITASGIERGAEVNATNGRVVLDVAQVGADGVRCTTTNGQIVVTIPSASKATLAARVVNGIIEVENLPVQATEESHRRLDATIGGGGPEIRLATTNGMIKIVGR